MILVAFSPGKMISINRRFIILKFYLILTNRCYGFNAYNLSEIQEKIFFAILGIKFQVFIKMKQK